MFLNARAGCFVETRWGYSEGGGWKEEGGEQEKKLENLLGYAVVCSPGKK